MLAPEASWKGQGRASTPKVAAPLAPKLGSRRTAVDSPLFVMLRDVTACCPITTWPKLTSLGALASETEPGAWLQPETRSRSTMEHRIRREFERIGDLQGDIVIGLLADVHDP